MSNDPAELHDGVTQLLGGVTNVRRGLATLRHQYLGLGAATLDVDDLGPEVSVPEILASVHQGLIGIGEALRTVTDGVYDTMSHTSRLRGKGDRQ
ncbi:hypothetical protein TPB0596_10130 [Tsukamurella pulmonis]|uniref:hypothetical protein n=1 Tax=Tsukamurella pulmonis TaxID=47312 RepID=UPI001EE05117|nr:hypothetical protein [Tsukamurella pulmonis]BDD81250.1 hypothetical protein TPB0596_10130 [Tsukamurella pulmonis]